MTRIRLRTAILLALALLVAGAWISRDAIILQAPGIVARLRDPVGPPRPVSWVEGPGAPTAAPAERPPNVVVILADDLGINDLAVDGHGGVGGGAVPTPHIDSLAATGVRLETAYTGNATCAPSRAAILTGRYPTRFGFEFTPAPKAFSRLLARFLSVGPHPAIYFTDREADVPPIAQQGVPADEITLAELLRERGYRTLFLGKWHLGEAPATRPEAQGFDEWLGFLAGASLYAERGDPAVVESRQEFDPIDRFLWANLPFAVAKDAGPRFAPPTYMTDYLAGEAARAIAANRHRPFFLYLALNTPHTPLQALRTDYDALPGIANHTERVYAAMIRSLDRAVGQVLDALRSNGLEQNTMVIFTSDNGGAHYLGLPGINQPYRGWKATFFEGGIRTPFLVRWPAGLPAGTTYRAPVAHVDVFATAAAAAGARLPADRRIDGIDLLPFLRGAQTGRPHETLFWRSGHYRAIRVGDWKLQVSERPPRTWLFDLATDPSEHTDLAQREPGRVAELRAVLAATEREMVAPAWPALLEGPVPIDHPMNGPDDPADEYVYWPN